MILIAPDVVHACNPIAGTPRSYHMLYIDNDWCCKLLSALYKQNVEQFTCEQNSLKAQEAVEKLPFLVSTLLTQVSEFISGVFMGDYHP
jgi:hypothetical protein